MNSRIVRVWIDEELCAGNALCLHDGGYLIEMDYIRNKAEIVALDRPYSEEECMKLDCAAKACPVQAIYLELEDSQIVNQLSND